MIRLQSISKSYGSQTVVDDVSFALSAGQTLCLIGSSGSGKSTTLRMLNRLIEPSGGSIAIQGEDIRSRDPVRLRRSIGYVIQQVGLFPHLSVGRNIGLMLEIEKWSRERIQARIAELLALVQLEPAFASRYPHQLSGG
ncbi:MAG: ATP-binding cassette domain-containing protein, partial [Candidatus Sericytochromatia bacterium]